MRFIVGELGWTGTDAVVGCALGSPTDKPGGDVPDFRCGSCIVGVFVDAMEGDGGWGPIGAFVSGAECVSGVDDGDCFVGAFTGAMGCGGSWGCDG